MLFLIYLLGGILALRSFMVSLARARLQDFLTASRKRGEDNALQRLTAGPAECFAVFAEQGDRLTPWLLLLGAMTHRTARIALIFEILLILIHVIS